jgi:hypothetical protein
MLKAVVAAILGIFSLAALAPAASATVLTFSLDPAVGTGNFIPGAYGDNVNALTDAVGSYLQGNGFTPDVTTDYATRNVSDDSLLSSNLRYWNVQYGDLVDVAYPSSHPCCYGEIVLLPAPGWTVRLNSFDLGGWAITDHSGQTVRVLDALTGTPLFAQTGLTIEGTDGIDPTHSDFDFPGGLSSSNGLRIRYAFANWFVGIDNVNFDQIASVPEPASGALFLLGFATVAVGAWRRSSTK